MVGRQEIVFMPGLLKELELERIVARTKVILIYIISLGIIRYMDLSKQLFLCLIIFNYMSRGAIDFLYS